MNLSMFKRRKSSILDAFDEQLNSWDLLCLDEASPLEKEVLKSVKGKFIAPLGEGGMTIVSLVKCPSLAEEFLAMRCPNRDFFKFSPFSRKETSKSYACQYALQLALSLHGAQVCRPYKFQEVNVVHSDEEFLVPILFEEAFNHDGLTLKTVLKNHFRVDPWYAVAVITNLAQTVSLIHNMGFNHHDIKPSNILVNENGLIKVIDFGIIRSRAFRNNPGSIHGTPNYIDNHYLKTGDPTYSDSFQVALTLYELIGGVKPFICSQKITPVAIEARCKKIEEGDYSPLIPLSLGEVNIIDDINSIVSKALKSDVSKRYQSSHDLYVDLQGVCDKYIPDLELLGDFFKKYATN